jgi:Recombinase
MNEMRMHETPKSGVVPLTDRGLITQKARAAAHRQLSAQANGRAARLFPIVAELNAAGITSMRGIAAALDERGIPTARGGPWSPAQVQRLMKRLRNTVG